MKLLKKRRTQKFSTQVCFNAYNLLRTACPLQSALKPNLEQGQTRIPSGLWHRHSGKMKLSSVVWWCFRSCRGKLWIFWRVETLVIGHIHWLQSCKFFHWFGTTKVQFYISEFHKINCHHQCLRHYSLNWITNERGENITESIPKFQEANSYRWDACLESWQPAGWLQPKSSSNKARAGIYSFLLGFSRFLSWENCCHLARLCWAQFVILMHIFFWRIKQLTIITQNLCSRT